MGGCEVFPAVLTVADPHQALPDSHVQDESDAHLGLTFATKFLQKIYTQATKKKLETTGRNAKKIRFMTFDCEDRSSIPIFTDEMKIYVYGS